MKLGTISRTLSILVAFQFLDPLALAQSANDQDQFSALRQELNELRSMQNEIAARISRIETNLTDTAGVNSLPNTPPEQLPIVQKPQVTRLAANSSEILSTNKLNISGDLRLRYEANFKNDDLPFRDREVVRGRLSAAYDVNSHNTIGARIATGNSDDPNTADVTLSSFNDDLTVSLDQLYWRFESDGVTVNAGKFANPLRRTDLVWDGDVSPQGLSVGYKRSLSDTVALYANSIYFIIDESTLGPESDMLGIQAGWSHNPNSNWSFDVTGAYLDYSLKNVTNADSGDFRSNLTTVDGSYLSDFNLVDVIANLEFHGISPRWPVQFTADYVRNLGSVTSADTGYSLDIMVGRVSQPGEYRFGYGYSQAETDAVLAAFSNDNTNLATNYRHHTLSFDYHAAERIMLNVTYYHYKPLDTGFGLGRDWQDRLRLNLIFQY